MGYLPDNVIGLYSSCLYVIHPVFVSNLGFATHNVASRFLFIKPAADSSRSQTHTWLLKSVSDLSDMCLRIFLCGENSSVISYGGRSSLACRFAISKLIIISALFHLIMFQTINLSTAGVWPISRTILFLFLILMMTSFKWQILYCWAQRQRDKFWVFVAGMRKGTI